MNFGEKIKKIRTDNHLTQEELAEKLFVTRTAISKWETGKGYPSVDSLKMLSNIFNISLDDLISDEDVTRKNLLDDKRAKKFYYIAVVFLTLTLISAVAAYFAKIPHLNVLSILCVLGYVSCAFFAKPKYKQLEAKKYIVTYIISRAVVLLIVIIAMIHMITTMA